MRALWASSAACSKIDIKDTCLAIDRDSLDERAAAGGRPAHMMRDAHASVSSACFLLSNPPKPMISIQNQRVGIDWRREWD